MEAYALFLFLIFSVFEKIIRQCSFGYKGCLKSIIAREHLLHNLNMPYVRLQENPVFNFYKYSSCFNSCQNQVFLICFSNCFSTSFPLLHDNPRWRPSHQNINNRPVEKYVGLPAFKEPLKESRVCFAKHRITYTHTQTHTQTF